MGRAVNEMIQAIVYDAVGTVLHVAPSVASVYADVARRFGIELELDEIHQRFQSAFAEQDHLDRRAGWQTSEAREWDRWRGIVAAVFPEIADADACFRTLFQVFASPAVWTFDPDWPNLLSNFQKRGLRQAVASNFDARLHGLIAALPAADILEQVLVSSEVGWRKPAPEFFACLLDSLQLPPSDILFVGDDRANDFDPACQLGFSALLFDPARKHLELGINRIDRLVELVPRLQKRQ